MRRTRIAEPRGTMSVAMTGESRDVRALLTLLGAVTGTPTNYFEVEPPPGTPRLYPRTQREVMVHDARPMASRLSIDREGVVLADHREGVMNDFRDDHALRSTYYQPGQTVGNLPRVGRSSIDAQPTPTILVPARRPAAMTAAGSSRRCKLSEVLRPEAIVAGERRRAMCLDLRGTGQQRAMARAACITASAAGRDALSTSNVRYAQPVFRTAGSLARRAVAPLHACTRTSDHVPIHVLRLACGTMTTNACQDFPVAFLDME